MTLAAHASACHATLPCSTVTRRWEPAPGEQNRPGAPPGPDDEGAGTCSWQGGSTPAAPGNFNTLAACGFRWRGRGGRGPCLAPGSMMDGLRPLEVRGPCQNARADTRTGHTHTHTHEAHHTPPGHPRKVYVQISPPPLPPTSHTSPLQRILPPPLLRSLPPLGYIDRRVGVQRKSYELGRGGVEGAVRISIWCV